MLMALKSSTHTGIPHPSGKYRHNYNKKYVLNDTFKENEHSNVPCNKVMADPNPMIPFQNMSSNEDIDMEDISNTEANPIQDCPGQQAWPCYP